MEAPPWFAVLQQIAHIRRLRAELAPLAVSPSRAESQTRLTPTERRLIFDLLRAIDELFPGIMLLLPLPPG